jgi:hypothetical protein
MRFRLRRRIMFRNGRLVEGRRIELPGEADPFMASRALHACRASWVECVWGRLGSSARVSIALIRGSVEAREYRARRAGVVIDG